VGGVLLLSVLEHLQSPQLALKEAYRVLVPGGKILVSVPFSFPIHGFPFDFIRWTMEGLKMEMRNAGFEIISENAIGNAFGSIVLNINLLLKYHIKYNKSRMLKGFMSLASPFLLVSQFFMNCAAIVLAPLYQSNALPLAIVMLGRKKEQNRR
jgi:SAM-dependent methyltransferase